MSHETQPDLIYMYKENEALNNLQWLICHKIIYIIWNRAIGLMSSVRQWSGRPGFNPELSHGKDSKNGT